MVKFETHRNTKTLCMTSPFGHKTSRWELKLILIKPFSHKLIEGSCSCLALPCLGVFHLFITETYYNKVEPC